MNKNILNKDIDKLTKSEKEALLLKLRKRVDFFDKILVYLLNRRTKATVLIGRIKISLGLPTYHPEREREVFKRVFSNNKGPLSEESLERIYERILDESRATQKSESPKLNYTKEKSGKISLRSLLSKKEFLIILLVFIAVFALLIYTFFSPHYYKGKSPIKFEIKQGATLNQVIDSLYDAGLIPNKRNMKIAAFLLGAERSIQAGRYRIPNGISYIELVTIFKEGRREVPVLINVHEGMTIAGVAHLLKEKLGSDSSEVISLCTDKKFISSFGLTASSFEGYLLPDSYFFYKDTPPMEVITKMKEKAENFLSDSLLAKIDQSKYNLHQILTMASIVEGESNKTEEFPMIAGVYYNRLKIGMKLQADPTVQYAYNRRWQRLYNRDLRINNPYNTYLYYGLPPGPINNPGKSAILAAIFPAQHNYLYFVADGNGGHIFTSSYSQHLKAVKNYRAWRDKQLLGESFNNSSSFQK